jgi:hypothetical protein
MWTLTHSGIRVAMQGTERFELWRDDEGSAPHVKLRWWYQECEYDRPNPQNESDRFESLAALAAAMQAVIGWHRIRMDVGAGETASGQQCVVVTRGAHETAGPYCSMTYVGEYARFVKRRAG